MTIDSITPSFTSYSPALYSTTDASSVDASDAPAEDGDPATSLTPDALMAYCQARLGSIDGQMRTSFADQQAHSTESQDIQQVLATLQTHAAGVSDSTSCATMETAMANLIGQLKAADPGSTELPTIQQTYNNMVYSGTGPTAANAYIDSDKYPPQPSGPQGDNVISADEMTSYVSALQGAVSDLNSGAELQMIQLQSLMSQRQTAISLTTNLVQSLGDQANKIADNIGH